MSTIAEEAVFLFETIEDAKTAVDECERRHAWWSVSAPVEEDDMFVLMVRCRPGHLNGLMQLLDSKGIYYQTSADLPREGSD